MAALATESASDNGVTTFGTHLANGSDAIGTWRPSKSLATHAATWSGLPPVREESSGDSAFADALSRVSYSDDSSSIQGDSGFVNGSRDARNGTWSGPGNRFGSWSRSMFFTRHTPHPQRCTFLTNVYGNRICSVRDDINGVPPPPSDLKDPDYLRSAFAFPPSTFDDARSRLVFSEYLLSAPDGAAAALGGTASSLAEHFPGSATWLSLDTVNALQYFTGLRNVSLNHLRKEQRNVIAALRARRPSGADGVASARTSAGPPPQEPLGARFRGSQSARNPPGDATPRAIASAPPTGRLTNGHVALIGVSPLSDDWMKELRSFTSSVFQELKPNNEKLAAQSEKDSTSNSINESEDSRRPSAYSARTGRLLSALDNRNTNSTGGSARGRSSSAAGRLLNRRTPRGLGGADLSATTQMQPPFKLLGLDKPDQTEREKEKPPTAGRMATTGRSGSALGREKMPRAASAMADARSRTATGNGLAAATPMTANGNRNGTADKCVSANGAHEDREAEIANADAPAAEMVAREYLVLRVLCQLLQTEDLRAVRSWLREAPPHEKGLALELVKKSIAASSAEGGRLEAPPVDWQRDAWKPFHARSMYETTYSREFRAPVPLKPIVESSEWSGQLPSALAAENESKDVQTESDEPKADILVVDGDAPAATNRQIGEIEPSEHNVASGVDASSRKLEDTSAAGSVAASVPAPPPTARPASRPALRLRTARCLSSAGSQTSRAATAAPSKVLDVLEEICMEHPRAKDVGLDTGDLLHLRLVGPVTAQTSTLQIPTAQQLFDRQEPIRPTATANNYARELDARHTRVPRAADERTKTWEPKSSAFALPVK